MLLKLQGYHFNLEYKPGKEMALADTLSRLPSKLNDSTIDLDTRVHTVRFTKERLDIIREETKKDQCLITLTSTIINGWPDSIKDLPEEIRSYWSYRDELSMEDGLIFKGERVIIPNSQKQTILDQLHYAHQGVEKTKLRARDSVYWKQINQDIEKLVKSCPICQEHQPSQQKETLRPHEIPQRPWEVLGTDLFHFQGAEYLLVADYYSKYFVVRKLGQNTSSSTVIRALKQILAEHGIPLKIISDNGPQFSAAIFKQFAEQWSFHHITSSPHYPKCNGFIERHVQTVKAALTKAQQAKADPDLALLCLRTTPISSNLPSPMEILTGRKAMSNIPTKLTSQQPEDNIRQELRQRQLTQKMQYDRTARDLSPLIPGQQIRHQDHTGKWREGEIMRQCEEPRSYIIRTPQGQELRRNRVQLRDIPQDTPAIQEPEPVPPAAATPNNKTPVVKQHQPTQAKPAAAKEANANTPYITRSGRAIHPPAKFDI